MVNMPQKGFYEDNSLIMLLLRIYQVLSVRRLCLYLIKQKRLALMARPSGKFAASGILSSAGSIRFAKTMLEGVRDDKRPEPRAQSPV